MGNITNLATTGNYDFEHEGLKVNFSFTVEKVENAPLRIENGSVTKEGVVVATFETPRFFVDKQRLKLSIDRGMEIEVTNAVVSAIASLSQKVTDGVL